MKPAYTDVKTMHTDIGYHMRMSGRRRHLLSHRTRWQMSWCTNRSNFMILLPLGVPVEHRNLLHALTSIFTPYTA